MQPRPPFDRALLIPIAIGVVSILGIAWILSASDLGEVLIPPTAAPSSVSYPGPGMPTPPLWVPPTFDEPRPTRTAGSPEPAEETPLLTGTLPTESPPAPSATATQTPDPLQLLPAGTYDDRDPAITYDRAWIVLKNPGTANAHRGALHVSTAIGNEASFRFTGTGFRLGYQRGKNFGIVTVIIDDRSYSFHEQSFDLFWRSPALSPGDHFVRIVHESGESINLDYIVILD